MTPTLAEAQQLPAADRLVPQEVVDGIGTVCMTGSIRQGPAQGKPFIIAVPGAQRDEFVARGFTPTTCEPVQLLGRESGKTCLRTVTPDLASEISHQQLFSLSTDEACRLLRHRKGALPPEKPTPPRRP